jgi:hypothetical protein
MKRDRSHYGAMLEWFVNDPERSPLDRTTALEEALRASVTALEELRTLHTLNCWRTGRDVRNSTTLRIIGRATARVWALTGRK